jgi:hypothetical protein
VRQRQAVQARDEVGRTLPRVGHVHLLDASLEKRPHMLCRSVDLPTQVGVAGRLQEQFVAGEDHQPAVIGPRVNRPNGQQDQAVDTRLRRVRRPDQLRRTNGQPLRTRRQEFGPGAEVVRLRPLCDACYPVHGPMRQPASTCRRADPERSKYRLIPGKR